LLPHFADERVGFVHFSAQRANAILALLESASAASAAMASMEIPYITSHRSMTSVNNIGFFSCANPSSDIGVLNRNDDRTPRGQRGRHVRTE
jgi:hypothetical protein